jgi:hypothetical protein
MGKWVVVPDIACNEFFKQFRNCLTVRHWPPATVTPRRAAPVLLPWHAALPMPAWPGVPVAAVVPDGARTTMCGLTTQYKDAAGFVAAVDRALQKEPAPLSDTELRYARARARVCVHVLCWFVLGACGCLPTDSHKRPCLGPCSLPCAAMAPIHAIVTPSHPQTVSLVSHVCVSHVSHMCVIHTTGSCPGRLPRSGCWSAAAWARATPRQRQSSATRQHSGACGAASWVRAAAARAGVRGELLCCGWTAGSTHSAHAHTRTRARSPHAAVPCWHVVS